MRRVGCRLAAVSAKLILAASAPAPDPGGSGGQSPPQRIVSLSPSATETLWALGAGNQVVAVDGQSNYPSEVPTPVRDEVRPWT